jgi:hypothetical protein
MTRQSVELFAGGGGMALGMRDAGFEHTSLVEWWKPAAKVLRHNAERQPDLWKPDSVLEQDVKQAGWSDDDVAQAQKAGTLTLSQRSALAGEEGRPADTTYLAHQAVARSSGRYPTEAPRVMPTRLGNVLRRIEDSTGKQYGLDIMLIGPQLTVVAAPERSAYINDSRQEMDVVAIRFCFFSLLAAVITTLWLAPTGWWVLTAAAPYTVGYVMYRGAIASAYEWGAALATAVDLDRFNLYQAMRVQPPTDTEEERTINRQLMALMRGESSAVVGYVTQSS